MSKPSQLLGYNFSVRPKILALTGRERTATRYRPVQTETEMVQPGTTRYNPVHEISETLVLDNEIRYIPALPAHWCQPGTLKYGLKQTTKTQQQPKQVSASGHKIINYAFMNQTKTLAKLPIWKKSQHTHSKAGWLIEPAMPPVQGKNRNIISVTHSTTCVMWLWQMMATYPQQNKAKQVKMSLHWFWYAPCVPLDLLQHNS